MPVVRGGRLWLQDKSWRCEEDLGAGQGPPNWVYSVRMNWELRVLRFRSLVAPSIPQKSHGSDT